jgi:hypothetical protein
MARFGRGQTDRRQPVAAFFVGLGDPGSTPERKPCDTQLTFPAAALSSATARVEAGALPLMNIKKGAWEGACLDEVSFCWTGRR